MKTFTKHLRWLLASLMLVAGMNSAWAQTDPYYTLDTTTEAAKTTSNSYSGTGTVTLNGIEWAVNGNGQMYPWRIGGKSLSSVDRTVNTNTAMGSAINKVVLTVGQASSITVNSLKLTVASDASFNTVLDEVSATFKASSDITFQPTTGTEWATGAYYKFTFNVTVSGSSNKFVQFSGVKFYAPTAANAVATPTFTPAAGTYTSAQSVELNTTTAGATIYYTTDGTDPTTSSSVYSSAISVSTTTTIKAMAVKSGMDNSAVASATYNFVSIEHAGTAEDPYTVADARAAIDAGTGITGVYVKGIVSEIVTAYNSQYGNITYNITEDGTTDGDFLQAFRGKSYNGDNFTSADDIQVGDEVVIYGNLKKYNTTYEFDANNQLVSLQRTAALSFEHTTYTATLGESFTTPTLNNPNSLSVTYSSSDTNVAEVDATTGTITLKAGGTTTITASSGETSAHYTLTVVDPNGPGTANNPYTVAQAIEFINTLGNSTSEDEVYVKGIISRVYSYNQTYGSITYWISDDGTTNNQMEVYGGLNFADVNEGRFESKDDLQAGDEVTVCGHVKMYNSTPEFDTDSHLVAFNRPAQKADPGLSFGETTTFTITVGDAFTAPTLSNPNNLTVTYSGDNDNLATVNAETGALTFVSGVTGNITVTATFAGDDDYKEGSASYTLIVNAAAGEGDYIKLTSTTELIDGGQYLIVYEDGSVAFNSSLETLDAVGNTISVVISDEKIASNATVDAAAFTIEAVEGGYSIKGSNGKYIGKTGNSNGLNTSDEALVNTISFDEGNAVIKGNGDYTLRYNSASNQTRFRYYASGQKPVALYLKNGVKDTREETSITFSDNGPFSVNLGDEFNDEPTATLEPAAAGSASDITYSSSDESVATVDATTGEVTIVGRGTCSIIAKFAGNENYKPCEAFYYITVTRVITPNPKNIDSEYYVKVKSLDQIEDGDAVIIVYEDGNIAMNTTQNPNNRTAVAVELNNETIQLTDGTDETLNNIPVTEKITLVKDGDYFYLYAGRNEEGTGVGFLHAVNNTENLLRTTTEPEGNNARAAISFDEDGNANIVFQCDRTDVTSLHGTVRWNNSANVFSCYAVQNTQQPIQLYVEVEKPDETVETVTLTETTDCYKTMVAPYDMDLTPEPTGAALTAYIVTVNDEQTEAEFVRVYRILAGTPIVIHADAAGTYELTKAVDGDDMDDVSANKLLASEGNVTGDGTVFVLNKVNDTLGFYPLKSGNTLAAGKCYLSIDRNAGAKFIGFTIDGEGTATGIETVESTTGKVRGTIYDLQGRRVAVPVHGLYIVNGKKVFVK